jgi:hypothetical protein
MINFLYDFNTATLTKPPIRTKLSQSNGGHKNFPLGCFFDEKRFKVYLIYR